MTLRWRFGNVACMALGQAGQAGRQDACPPPRENAGGRNADLGNGNEANGHETLQQLRGELRRLAPTLERAVGALAVVQHFDRRR